MAELDAREVALRSLEELLERKRPVNTMGTLLAATQQASPAIAPSLKGAAICLDTNVFFRLSNSGNREQIVDYLATQHLSPIVVSAQSMQEVWNNYLNAIDTIASDIGKRLDELAKVMVPLDSGFSDYKNRFDIVIDDFRSEYGHLHNEGMKDKVRSLIEVMQRKALFSEVSRSRFERFFAARKITKTPPGFRDDGAGDYYVWLDFLFGLKMKKVEGVEFDRAVLVTDDRKIDWVKGGAAHPTLVSECLSYVEVPLEIWTIKRLAEATRA